MTPHFTQKKSKTTEFLTRLYLIQSFPPSLLYLFLISSTIPTHNTEKYKISMFLFKHLLSHDTLLLLFQSHLSRHKQRNLYLLQSYYSIFGFDTFFPYINIVKVFEYPYLLTSIISHPSCFRSPEMLYLEIQNEAGQRLIEFYQECTGQSKHPLSATHETTLHTNITRWSISKSD